MTLGTFAFGLLVAALPPPEGGASAAPSAPVPGSWQGPPYDPEFSGKFLAFWEKRAEGPRGGALDWREVAGAALARLRESGDVADAVKAERAATKSYELMTKRNVSALKRRASAVLAQHRFPEALALAKEAAESNPDSYRMVADVLIELGDLKGARAAWEKAPPSEEAEDLNRLAMLARFAAIEGKDREALGHWRDACAIVDHRPDLPHEVAAWHYVMLGHFLIDRGALDAGERYCREALRIFPRDHRAMTGLAEASAARGEHAQAIERATQAFQWCPSNPEVVVICAEANRALGREEEARTWDARLDALAKGFPRIHDRHWIEHFAGRGERLEEALKLAKADLVLRQDPGAHAALGLVLLKLGKTDEAGASIAKALELGPCDPHVVGLAADFAKATGDPAKADVLREMARVLAAPDLGPDLEK